MSDTILKGPYEFDIHVHVTDGKGRVGKITIGLSMGVLPTQKDLDEAINKASETAEAAGFKLMNKADFFNQMMAERCGATERFACPGGNDWDA